MEELRGRELWAHIRIVGIVRRLELDLDALAYASPACFAAVPGVKVFLADMLAEESPKGAEILRRRVQP